MEFTNLKQLEAYVNKQMADVMKTSVSQKIKDIEQEKVITEVYDKYTPSSPDKEPFVYERRAWNGGLADQRNMHEQVNITANGVELTVENVTKGKDDNFGIADLVEYGDGHNGKEYEYKKNRDGTAYQYLRARPFTHETEKTLVATGEHVKAFKQGMKAKGIDIE